MPDPATLPGLCLAITPAAFLMVDGRQRLPGVMGTDVIGRISGLLLAATHALGGREGLGQVAA